MDVSTLHAPAVNIPPGFIKALTVRQPFAGLIASGQKTLEIRGMRCHYRGPLLICAGQEWHELADMALDHSSDYPRGVMLCVVDLVGCRPMVPADADAACIGYRPDYFAWELTNVRRVQPQKVRGNVVLFDVAGDQVVLQEA